MLWRLHCSPRVLEPRCVADAGVALLASPGLRLSDWRSQPMPPIQCHEGGPFVAGRSSLVRDDDSCNRRNQRQSVQQFSFVAVAGRRVHSSVVEPAGPPSSVDLLALRALRLPAEVPSSAAIRGARRRWRSTRTLRFRPTRPVGAPASHSPDAPTSELGCNAGNLGPAMWAGSVCLRPRCRVRLAPGQRPGLHDQQAATRLPDRRKDPTSPGAAGRPGCQREAAHLPSQHRRTPRSGDAAPDIRGQVGSAARRGAVRCSAGQGLRRLPRHGQRVRRPPASARGSTRPSSLPCRPQVPGALQHAAAGRRGVSAAN